MAFKSLVQRMQPLPCHYIPEFANEMSRIVGAYIMVEIRGICQGWQPLLQLTLICPDPHPNMIKGCFKYWGDNNIPLLFLEKVLASGRLHGSLQTPPSSRFFPLLKCERRRPILNLYWFIHTHIRGLWGEWTSSTSENWHTIFKQDFPLTHLGDKKRK